MHNVLLSLVAIEFVLHKQMLFFSWMNELILFKADLINLSVEIKRVCSFCTKKKKNILLKPCLIISES